MNESLLCASAVVSVAFIYTAWRFGKEQLYSAIIVFLILVSTVGGKIVEFFGYATNTGNIFYASVFLATYFLIERYGKREGIRSIWIGAVGLISFFLLVQIAVALHGSSATGALNDALALAFSPVPRVALASLIAYIVSQRFNIYIYFLLKKRMDGKRLWFRANISNICAQLVDSAIFFTIAFAGVAGTNLWEVFLTGFVVKVVYVMLASPLLYLNTVEEEESQGYSSVTIR